MARREAGNLGSRGNQGREGLPGTAIPHKPDTLQGIDHKIYLQSGASMRCGIVALFSRLVRVYTSGSTMRIRNGFNPDPQEPIHRVVSQPAT